ncbi:hypothetical protein GGE07_003983 [Sinorhizobium terangae]|nr:hypothetical protein [Sinorhizobium terangae]
MVQVHAVSDFQVSSRDIPINSLLISNDHFRDQQMRELDVVLERDDGTIAAIEVSASATVKVSDSGASGRLQKHMARNLPLAPSFMTIPMLCRSATGLPRRHCPACGDKADHPTLHILLCLS